MMLNWIYEAGELAKPLPHAFWGTLVHCLLLSLFLPSHMYQYPQTSTLCTAITAVRRVLTEWKKQHLMIQINDSTSNSKFSSVSSKKKVSLFSESRKWQWGSEGCPVEHTEVRWWEATPSRKRWALGWTCGAETWARKVKWKCMFINKENSMEGCREQVKDRRKIQS